LFKKSQTAQHWIVGTESIPHYSSRIYFQAQHSGIMKLVYTMENKSVI